ncbi:hypothetical protein PSP31121_04638 [Pandoraea sputorum]|uniref:Uncharacterized protein n=1 Tax=Pandoraea sputorum TaxID=93222 RepID=A0A5E5BFR2_9BURK|nr:hypothetical protein PSP31121_04638 [Pandoraea sputorum]
MDNQISSTNLVTRALQDAALTSGSENIRPAAGQIGFRFELGRA